MTTIDNIIQEKQSLITQYAGLLEDAYNHRESDQALSDIFEYEAIQVKYKIEYLESQLSESLV